MNEKIRYRVEFQGSIDGMEFKTLSEARARRWNLKEMEIAAGYKHEEMHIYKVTYEKQVENGWVIKETISREIVE